MKKYFGALVFIVLLGLAGGIFTLITPSVVSSETHFSADKCAEDIKFISQEIHNLFQPSALARVRNYLVTRMTELNLDPIVMTYEDVEDRIASDLITINNIYGKTEGDFSSYILLVAHYDSSPKKRVGEDNDSKGAADDGYGLSVALELVRLLNNESDPLVNGIKVLFTDGEETGLHGSKFASQNPEIMENVSLIINIEARGVKGPAVMFETSANNANIIKLYKKGYMPFSYSLAASVYGQMSNSTDLTPFLSLGYNGINIAVLDNLDYYHTAMDNYSNINLRSIQHYGEQLYPVVKEFVFSSDYSSLDWADADNDSTFFTLLPGIFVTYGPVISWVLLGLAILLCIFLGIQLQDNRSLKYSFNWLLKWLLNILVITVIGLGITLLMSKISGIPFKITYMPRVPGANTILIALIVIEILFFIITAMRNVSRGITTVEVLSGGVLLHLLISIVMMIFLPGGAFLFVIPCILSALACISLNLKSLHRLFSGLAIGFIILMFFPILYLLHITLTIGSMFLVLFLLGAALATLVPMGIALASATERF